MATSPGNSLFAKALSNIQDGAATSGHKCFMVINRLLLQIDLLPFILTVARNEHVRLYTYLMYDKYSLYYASLKPEIFMHIGKQCVPGLSELACCCMYVHLYVTPHYPWSKYSANWW